MKKMPEDLRLNIAATTDGWEPVTGVLWTDGTPWQVLKFERDVEHEEALWRCVILERVVYDPDDLSAVDYAEAILADAWPL